MEKVPAQSPDDVARAVKEGKAPDLAGGELKAADFVKLVLSSCDDANQAVTPTGIAIYNAKIDGRVELDNAMTRDGGPLPAIELHGCTLMDGFSARHARFSRLSLKKCKFCDPVAGAANPGDGGQASDSGEPDRPSEDTDVKAPLDLSGSDLGSDLELEEVGPEAEGGHFWIRAIGVRIDGSLDLSQAELRVPMATDIEALDLTQAEIKGDLTSWGGFSTAGRVKGRNLQIEGDVWLVRAKLDGLGRESLFFQSARIGGSMVLEGRAKHGDDRDVFVAQGGINLYQLKVGGRLNIGNADIRGSADAMQDGDVLALVLKSAVLGSAVIGTCPQRSKILGKVQLTYATVQNELEVRRTCLGADPGLPDERPVFDARSLGAKKVVFDGVRPLPRDGDGSFDPELHLLSIDLTDATVGKVEVRNSRINGKFKAAPFTCAGDVEFDARMGPELNLEGANIGGSLDISRLRMDRGKSLLSLKDGNIARALRLVHRPKPGEPQPDRLEASRVTRLSCLRDTSLIETLWSYKTERGERRIRQLAFLEHKEVVRALDRRADTLAAFVGRYGHAIKNERSAAEYARLYCAYGQSDRTVRLLLDGTKSLPPGLVRAETAKAAAEAKGSAPAQPAPSAPSETATDATLPPAYLTLENPRTAVDTGVVRYSFDASLLLDDVVKRVRMEVAVNDSAVTVAYCEAGLPPVRVTHIPVCLGLFAEHPDNAQPVEPVWVMPRVLRGSVPDSEEDLMPRQKRLWPHLKSSFSIHGTADLRDLCCDTLDDQAGRFWGRHILIRQDHFVYRQATWEPDEKPPKLPPKERLQRWWDRQRAEWLYHRFINRQARERLRQRTDYWHPWQIRRNWIFQQFPTSPDLVCTRRHTIRRHEHRPQPFDQAARVARAEGRDDFAIQFEIERRRIDWQFFAARARWKLGYLGIILACVFLAARGGWRAAMVTLIGMALVMALMAFWRVLAGTRWPVRIVPMATAFTGIVVLVFFFGNWDLRPLDFLIAALIFTVVRYGAKLSDFSMWFMFGYLRRPVNAIATLFGAFLIGWAGVHAANQYEMLVIDAVPVATAAGSEADRNAPRMVMVAPGAALDRPFAHNVPCEGTISEPLYALDVLIPLIDLRQESRCEVKRVHRDFMVGDEADERAGEAPPTWNGAAGSLAHSLPESPRGGPFQRLGDAYQRLRLQLEAVPRKENFWLGLKALYALAGWFLVSLSILTFAQIHRTPSDTI